MEDSESKKYRMQSIETMQMDSNYYDDLPLHPRTELHKKLVRYLLDYARAGKTVTDSVRAEWKRLDWTLQAYVPLDEAEKKLKSLDNRKPLGVVIPASFASLEVFCTYMMSAFVRDPIHRYTRGRGGLEGKIKAILMERVVAKQSLWFKEALQLNTLFQDAFRYGVGYARVRWAKKTAKQRIDQEVSGIIAEGIADLIDVAPGDVLSYMKKKVIAEGSKIEPIDPYRVILDPNVSPNDIQDSEFFGWVSTENVHSLMRREKDPEENLINTKAVKKMCEDGFSRSKIFGERDDGRDARTDTYGAQDTVDVVAKTAVDVLWMMCDIIPKDWNLGDGDEPEKWMFAVAGDDILIQCYPLDLDHGMYPIIACAPNTDGHSVLPVSHLATTFGLQNLLDWLFRSHIDNIRKAINDMLIVNPQAVEWDDIMNPNPGKIIRLTPEFYFSGQSMDNLVKQLPVTDVTRGHMNDASVVLNLLRECNGTTDITMGNLSGLPERPTAAGVDAAQSGALSRLQRLASIIGYQCMQDLGWQYGYNTVQFMSQDMQVAIAGRYEETLRKAYMDQGQNLEDINVSPMDLDVSFDIEPYDGSLPDKENVNAWTQVLQTLLGVDGVAQDLVSRSNVMGIFQHWARISGARDMSEFMTEGGGSQQINPMVMPDQQGGALQQAVQAGNVVPMSEFGR